MLPADASDGSGGYQKSGPVKAPAPVTTAPAAPVPAALIPTPPPAPSPSPSPAAAPSPSPAALIPTALTSPSGQTAPVIGTPTGYDLSAGVKDSTQDLLPTGFDTTTMKGTPLADATTPATSTYSDQQAALQNDPTDWTVTKDQTVAGQYADLMSKGNPAIEAAEQATIRANASHGGGNNLMTQSAAAMSGSQVALTIASADAATQAAAGQFNATAANQFKASQDAFNDNMLLSKQNFDQGIATMKDQTNQNVEQLYAQVEANAATQSTNLKATIAQMQAQTTATMETMDKTFSQSVATLGLQQQYANDNAWTQYGMGVRTSYLASVQTQQTNLMQTIAEIRSNPNATAAQAASAVQDAVTQFNSFMTMNNAYYSSMVPTGSGSYP